MDSKRVGQICSHMNQHHHDSLLSIVRHYGKKDYAQDCVLTHVDEKQLVIAYSPSALTNAYQRQEVRILFRPPVDATGLRARMIEMSNQAMSSLGYSSVHVSLVTGPDLLGKFTLALVAFAYYILSPLPSHYPGHNFDRSGTSFARNLLPWIVRPAVMLGIPLAHLLEYRKLMKPLLDRHGYMAGGSSLASPFGRMWFLLTLLEGGPAIRRYKLLVDNAQAKAKSAKGGH